MKRAFTRSQIEAWFMEHFGKSYVEGGDTVKISKVTLLEEMKQPMWVVDYTVISPPIGTLEHRYHSKIIVIQALSANGEPRLEPPRTTDLPQGCPSVAEEDKAVKAEAEEASRAAERRARVETHMAVDYGGDY